LKTSSFIPIRCSLQLENTGLRAAAEVVSHAKLEILRMRQNKTENFAGIYAAASTAADTLKYFTIMCQSQRSSISICNP
jgi:hypothetical protein